MSTDHDPLCLYVGDGPCRLCFRLETARAEARADERAKWLKWAAKNACCEAGLVASPDPCPWHPEGVRERIAQGIEAVCRMQCVRGDDCSHEQDARIARGDTPTHTP